MRGAPTARVAPTTKEDPSTPEMDTTPAVARRGSSAHGAWRRRDEPGADDVGRLRAGARSPSAGPAQIRTAQEPARRPAAVASSGCRATLLGAMAVSTAAFAAGRLPGPVEPLARAAPAGLTAFEVLSSTEPTVEGGEAVLADHGTVTVADRAVISVSHSVDRAPLGCSGVVTEVGPNGRLPDSALCDLWQAPFKDRPDAVVSLFELNDAYRAAFGSDMCISSAYRDIEEQLALKARKGSLAASAGTSNHGWGLAIDFCEVTYTGERGRWLHEVGAVFGWENPDWAHAGGAGPYEPWHWEFAEAVAELQATVGRG